MKIFDEFLTNLCEMGKPVRIISGNHDAPGRISYFGTLLKKNQVTVPAAFNGTLQAVSDPEDPIQIYLLPFVTPARVRSIYPDSNIRSYQDAVEVVLQHSDINPEKVNILVAHQYISGGVKGEEEFAIGGLDAVEASVFDAFDFVALGHLHQPQKCGRDTIRYAGSPLKYSLSEEHQKKYFSVIEIQDKQHISIQKIPVQLPHDIRTVKGDFETLCGMPATEDFVCVILTDEHPVPDARVMLRNHFPHMLQFRIENARQKTDHIVSSMEIPEELSPLDMFCMFYENQNNARKPTERQLAIVREIFAELQEAETQA